MANVWPPNDAGAVNRFTSTWFSSSQPTSRLASASLRWPAPTGITNAVGYGTIQLLSVSNGAGQQAGRAAPATPRRLTSSTSRRYATRS